MKQIFRRTSWNLPNRKERRVLAIIFPLVDTNDSVKKLTLFLLGHALLQSSRTKFSVAWLEILGLSRDIIAYEELQQPFRRPHIHVRWARGPTNMHFQISIDSSLASPPLHRQLSSRFQRKHVPRRRKTPTTMTNHDPRINRISSIALFELPPNTASIRRL
jgi:hypothetical protein